MSYTPIPAGTPDWDVPVNAAFTDQDGRITSNTASIDTQSTQITNLQTDVGTLQTDVADNTADIATNTANIATNTSNIATNTSNISTLQTQSTQVRNGGWLPSDYGFIAWSIDPSEAANNLTLTSGTILMVGLQIRQSTNFSNIIVHLQTGGSTLTAGQNLVGLYDSAGNRVAQSADQSANWTTNGLKIVPMTGAPIALTPGLYYVAILSNGTTPVTIVRETSISSNIINTNLTVATARVAELAGQTTLPATITPGSRTFNVNSPFFAIS